MNGEAFSERRNYYHKPIANFNWDWKIDDASSLSTVLYASVGRGGGTGPIGGRINVNADTGLKDYQSIYDANIAKGGGETTSAIRGSVNNHSWYGVVTNYNRDLTKNISFNFGADLRTYYGEHFRQITNLLGGDYFVDGTFSRVRTPNQQIRNTFKPHPWSSLLSYASTGDRVAYDYSETINYGGVFSQIEYATDNFSAFFQGALSNQTHQRYDFYQYTPENESAKKVSNIGYNVKGGASYKINNNHMIFANAGMYSRQPFHDNIYLNYRNDINPFTSNEDILGLEAGYKFTSRYFSFNVNAYQTTWENRVLLNVRNARKADADKYGINVGDLINTLTRGVSQNHRGVEFDFIASPIYGLDVRGFASIGDWRYKGVAIEEVRDEDRNLLGVNETDLDGGKVGNSAQTTFGVGFNYKVTNALSFDADFRHFKDLYADVQAKENLLLPSYSVVDAGLTFGFDMTSSNRLIFRLNVNNVLDTEYISQSSTAQQVDGDTTGTYKGIDNRNQVLFGFGRTWNASVKFTF